MEIAFWGEYDYVSKDQVGKVSSDNSVFNQSQILLLLGGGIVIRSA